MRILTAVLTTALILTSGCSTIKQRHKATNFNVVAVYNPADLTDLMKMVSGPLGNIMDVVGDVKDGASKPLIVWIQAVSHNGDSININGYGIKANINDKTEQTDEIIENITE